MFSSKFIQSLENLIQGILDGNTTCVVLCWKHEAVVKRLGFGELELSILKIIRELKQATVRDVFKNLGSVGSYTTIMTVMSRMADKGELMREKVGKQYVYWLSQNNSPSKNILHRIREKVFGGKSTAMVSYLLETDREISDRDLAEIEKLIEKRRKGAKRG